MRKISLVLLIALCTNAWFAGRTLGEPAKVAADKSEPKVAATAERPKPEDLLRGMAEYIGKLPAFSCRIESIINIKTPGGDNKMATKMTVRLQRPNRLALIVDEGVMGLTAVSDGKKLTQYLPIIKRYVVKDAPANLADVTDTGAPASLTMLGMSSEVIPTDGDSFYKELMSGVTESRYVGAEKIGDVLCHHCRFVQEDYDWDIWIEDGKRPLVHKVMPDLSKQLAGAADGVKMSYTVTLSDWDVSPKFTDADFTFKPPADAEQVESLFEGMAGDEEEAPHPLLGQPAPPFETTDLEEHPFDLKKHLGKDVILLDFWATWCGPCIEAMPKIDAVAKKFADKGLVFRAVNVAEDAETVKEFLKSSELKVPVAMDPEGEIAQRYQAEGIPQTVLIGKDGKVQVVHVGYITVSGLIDELSKEITDLLAGKDLASAELARIEDARKKRGEKETVTPEDKAENEPPADPTSDTEKPADDSNGKP